MTKTSISQKALKTIQQQHLKPTPRWHFLSRNIFFWTLALLSLLVFALGLSLSVYMIQNPEFTPYFWSITAFFFVLITTYFLRHTKKSYRLDPKILIISILFFGATIGLIFHRLNAAPLTDNYLAHRFKIYRSLAPLKQQVWSDPSSGYLSGKIISLDTANQFTLLDFNGKTWTITHDQPLIRGWASLTVGLEIKLIGQQLSSDSFKVNEIRPWGFR